MVGAHFHTMNALGQTTCLAFRPFNFRVVARFHTTDGLGLLLSYEEQGAADHLQALDDARLVDVRADHEDRQPVGKFSSQLSAYLAKQGVGRSNWCKRTISDEHSA
jgi:hypothetical protein